MPIFAARLDAWRLIQFNSSVRCTLPHPIFYWAVFANMRAEAGQRFKLIIQFVAPEKTVPAYYRVIAYHAKAGLGPSKFYSASDLLERFEKAEIPAKHRPRLVAKPPSETTIVYAEELVLSSAQLRVLGLQKLSF
jgi:hypothetical protein